MGVLNHVVLHLPVNIQVVGMEGDIKDGKWFGIDDSNNWITRLSGHPLGELHADIVVPINMQFLYYRGLEFTLSINDDLLIGRVQHYTLIVITTSGDYGHLANPGCLGVIIDAVYEHRIDRNMVITDQVECQSRISLY